MGFCSDRKVCNFAQNVIRLLQLCGIYRHFSTFSTKCGGIYRIYTAYLPQCTFTLRVARFPKPKYGRFFSARQHNAVARYMLSLVVRLSLCPSHGWISQKRLTLGSCNFHHRVAPIPHDSSFLTVNFTPKFQGEHREWGRRIREGRKNTQFSANKIVNSHRISETVQDRTKVTIMTNRKSHMRFRLVPKSMTLDDLELL